MSLRFVPLPFPGWSSSRLRGALQAAAVTEPGDLEAERRWIERFLEGDEEAFAPLFERFAPLVYSLAMRLSGREEDAADLTQEVFLKVTRSLAGFRRDASLKTWIYRITVNELATRIAARQRQRRVFAQNEPRFGDADDGRDAVDAANPRAPGLDPEANLLAAEADRVVDDAIAALPEPFKSTVVLRDLEGLAYEECAEVLGVPIGTVRSRLARGRALLREHLAPYVRGRQA